MARKTKLEKEISQEKIERKLALDKFLVDKKKTLEMNDEKIIIFLKRFFSPYSLLLFF